MSPKSIRLAPIAALLRMVDISIFSFMMVRFLGIWGFSDALNTADNLAGRLSNAVRGDRDTAQLISVATDGETFGTS